MNADPAELIFFHEMTPEKFFDEVNRLGVSEEKLLEEDLHDQVFRSCLIKIRAETAKAVAGSLKVPITEEQAWAIARHSLVPDVLPEPAPLTPDQRAIAMELYYHAIRAAVARHGSSISERAARARAKRKVRDGQRGLTWLQKFGRVLGC